METKFDDGLYEKICRGIEKNDAIEILQVKNKCISAKGGNFLSDLFKATIKYRILSSNDDKKDGERTTGVIIKIEPLECLRAKEIVQEQKLFLTEFEMLIDVLPKIKRLTGYSIGPEAFYGTMDSKILVMEDLTRRGFVTKDRQRGLSLSHCMLLIEQIAKLHAGSVLLKEKDPESVKRFKNGIVSSNTPVNFFKFMRMSLLKLSKEISERWSTEYAQAVEKIQRLAENIGTLMTKAYEYDTDEFCVLNHGDCWVNNIMFRENEKGKPCEVLMVDYQMSVFTSPVIDLIYFLNICPEIPLKYDKDDFLLEHYLKHLTNNMKSIGCKTNPPTMRDLKDSIYKRRIYTVFSGIILYPRMVADVEDTEDFDDILYKLDGDTRMDVLKSPVASKALQKMIPAMMKRGYLD